MTYTALIVGAGRIAATNDEPGSPHIQTHAHALSANESIQLLGFVDTVPALAEQAAARWQTRAFENLASAFAQGPIDLVTVATPDDTHYEVLKALCEFPVRLVLAEKPLATTSAQADKLDRLYREKGITLAVNYVRRFVPAFETLRQEIRAGHWGRFVRGSGFYGKGLFHNGSHLLDLLQLLIGPCTAEKILDVIEDHDPADPSESALLRDAGGAPFLLQAFDSRHFTLFEIDLVFEKGRIRILDGGLRIERSGVRPYDIAPGYVVLGESNQIETGLARGMEQVVENLLGCLKNGTAPKSGAENACQVLALCERIRSMR